MRYFVVLDTETTNSIEDPIAYDIGFAVIDENGNIIEAFSYAVAEIFLDKELMATAFFIDKIPQYWEEIQQGVRELRKMDTIANKLRQVCKQYEVEAIVAHNARFDYRSTALTRRYITTSQRRYFLPYGIELWDSLRMAREVFKNDDEYGEFCCNNQFLTSRGVRRYTAEILYRFLINDITFEEVHKGIDDVQIEAKIFAECLKRGAKNCKCFD